MAKRLTYQRMYYWSIRCCVCRVLFKASRPHKTTCSAACRQVKCRKDVFLHKCNPKLKWLKN